MRTAKGTVNTVVYPVQPCYRLQRLLPLWAGAAWAGHIAKRVVRRLPDPVLRIVGSAVYGHIA